MKFILYEFCLNNNYICSLFYKKVCLGCIMNIDKFVNKVNV